MTIDRWMGIPWVAPSDRVPGGGVGSEFNHQSLHATKFVTHIPKGISKSIHNNANLGTARIKSFRLLIWSTEICSCNYKSATRKNLPSIRIYFQHSIWIKYVHVLYNKNRTAHREKRVKHNAKRKPRKR